MTIEDRLASVERRLRIHTAINTLLAGALIVAAVVFARLPNGRWSVSEKGQATFGAAEHRTGATVDIVGPSNDSAGLSVIAVDPAQEAFFAQFSGNLKTLSVSSIWDDYPATSPRAAGRFILARYNATWFNAQGVLRDDIGLMQCGHHGSVFYPQDSQSARDCPAEPDALALSGNLYARKDVHITGRLFLNGVEIRPR